MDRLAAHRLTAWACSLMGAVAALIVFVTLPDGIHVSLHPGSADPTRYCFTVTGSEPWSCYLKDDIPAGLVPVWVGPESLIPKEGR